jgi:hypothetical protein
LRRDEKGICAAKARRRFLIAFMGALPLSLAVLSPSARAVEEDDVDSFDILGEFPTANYATRVKPS